jgi:hypothetical protein
MPSRRDVIRQLALGAPLVLLAPACRPLRPRGAPVGGMRADLVIAGGGLGGCAAALAACANGLRVILTEETDWIGGQLTAQAVPPDENRWIETIGGTASYRALREAVRARYRRDYPLTAHARTIARLNPGSGWVSRLCADPRTWLAELEALLAPQEAVGTLHILRRHRVVAADVQGDRVRALRARSLETGRDVVLEAPCFADATELGDLLPLTGTEYMVGAESRAQTGEPHAKDAPEPDNVQGFTVCVAMDWRPREDHTIARPAQYDRWRAQRMRSDEVAGAPLLSFDDPDSRPIGFDPVARKGFWSYRRIVDRDLFTPGSAGGAFDQDCTIVNWIQNDYAWGSLTDGTAADAAQHLEAARQLSLSLLYWLQVECPRPDGGQGWRGLRLRPDVVGTADGLAKAPYIREGRRIVAEATVLEQHVTLEGRMAETGATKEAARAYPWPDSVGIGHYSMDLHVSTRGDRGRYGDTLPFQIPLGALLPRRMENLLPACKNLGVTHLTNGCYRLHPIEWNVGEAVGHLVALARRRGTTPRAVRHTAALLADYQRQLEAGGIPLAWPDPLPPG